MCYITNTVSGCPKIFDYFKDNIETEYDYNVSNGLLILN